MVTAEFDHSTSGALKNAIDFRYAEWNNSTLCGVNPTARPRPPRPSRSLPNHRGPGSKR
jgi:hypothetical protein